LKLKNIKAESGVGRVKRD